MSDKTPVGMEEVIFVVKDCKASWREDDERILNKVEGIIYFPYIEDQIDMNMMVKGPDTPRFKAWLDENAMLLYDAGGGCDELAWDNNEVYGLSDDGSWKLLEYFLEDM
jgi:hypothetical protein